MRSRLQELRAKVDAHHKKQPKQAYKKDENGVNQYSLGYSDEYKTWDAENRNLYRDLHIEQRLEENRVLSHIHVPKGLAHKLALHGFNEKCYRSYYKKHQGLKKPMRYPSQNYGNRTYSKEEADEPEWDLHYELYSPTYDQVALWFTEKYQVDFISSPEEGRKKLYRCDPVTPELGLVNLPFCNSAQEAQLQAFAFLLTKLKHLPKPQKEEDHSFTDSATGELVKVGY